MRKPLSTRITRLSSRTHLGRLLHWNLSKDLLSEIGPIQWQLDQLEKRVGMLDDFIQLRILSISDEVRETDRSLNKELWKLTIGFGSAIVILSLGCLIGFLVN